MNKSSYLYRGNYGVLVVLREDFLYNSDEDLKKPRHLPFNI
jgi:hypothetical protein